MSLVTRLIGFGLCVVGAFVAGFYQALHSTGITVNGIILSFTAEDLPSSFYAAATAEVNSYLQHNVTNVWTYGIAVGIAIAVGGLILVAMGDKKPAKPESQTPRQSEPLAVNQRE